MNIHGDNKLKTWFSWRQLIEMLGFTNVFWRVDDVGRKWRREKIQNDSILWQKERRVILLDELGKEREVPSSTHGLPVDWNHKVIRWVQWKIHLESMGIFPQMFPLTFRSSRFAAPKAFEEKARLPAPVPAKLGPQWWVGRTTPKWAYLLVIKHSTGKKHSSNLLNGGIERGTSSIVPRRTSHYMLHRSSLVLKGSKRLRL